MAVESELFQSRLIGAAKDVHHLLAGGELPTWDDFQDGPATSEWPPLTLGICPVMGGAFKENTKDWTTVGTGAAVGVVGCGGFHNSGDYTKFWLCILGVAVVVLIAIAVVA
jgi:hypothetical protein